MKYRLIFLASGIVMGVAGIWEWRMTNRFAAAIDFILAIGLVLYFVGLSLQAID